MINLILARDEWLFFSATSSINCERYSAFRNGGIVKCNISNEEKSLVK
jgi:hypothetical protein